MLKVKVGRIGLLDALKFKNLPSRRDKVIDRAEDKPVVSDYPINRKARELHPGAQRMKVSDILGHGEAGATTYVLNTVDGSPAAFFRAGQYVTLSLDGKVRRPYSISSSPEEALKGMVSITVKDTDGFFPQYLKKGLKRGDEVVISGPQGTFHYQKLRDAGHVVAVAGGSGITPFLSMAKAIRDGNEDFRLTILYGSRTEGSILFREELSALEGDRIKVVHVLSDEEKDGYEKGFVSSSLVEKYSGGGDYSLFVCGPEGLYRFMKGEVEKLGLPARRVRYEVQGTSRSFVESLSEKSFSITVRQCGREYAIPASGKEPILVALERTGIKAPSRCRAGECGWCRSRLVSGDVAVPEDNDGRRFQDRVGDAIHPCVSYPLGDLVIEVPGEV